LADDVSAGTVSLHPDDFREYNEFHVRPNSRVERSVIRSLANDDIDPLSGGTTYVTIALIVVIKLRTVQKTQEIRIDGMI
jgi:hypothetical protein